MITGISSYLNPPASPFMIHSCFNKYSEAKEVLWKFRRPHKDTSFENAESANGNQKPVSQDLARVLDEADRFLFHCHWRNSTHLGGPPKAARQEEALAT